MVDNSFVTYNCHFKTSVLSSHAYPLFINFICFVYFNQVDTCRWQFMDISNIEFS